MPDNRIMFDKDNVRFNYRVAGVAIHNNTVLLVRMKEFSWWTLLGGRVEMMERSDEALLREMKEELGTEVKIERLLWTTENFHGDETRYGHEINMFYLMMLPQNCHMMKCDEYATEDDGTPILFKWIPRSEISQVEVYPSFLKKALLKLPEKTEHIIWNEINR